MGVQCGESYLSSSDDDESDNAFYLHSDDEEKVILGLFSTQTS
jgi:hypothetical protein